MLLSVTSLFDTYQKKVTTDLYKRLKGLGVKTNFIEYNYSIKNDDISDDQIRSEVSSIVEFDVPVSTIKACMNLTSLSKKYNELKDDKSIIVTDIDPFEVVKTIAETYKNISPSNVHKVDAETVANLLGVSRDILLAYGTVTNEVDDILNLTEVYKKSTRYFVDVKTSKEEICGIYQEGVVLRDLIKNMCGVGGSIINSLTKTLVKMFKDKYIYSILDVFYSKYTRISLPSYITITENPSVISELSTSSIIRNVMYNVENIKPYIGRLNIALT